MFGIAAFSAAPFSSTAGSVYSESVTVSASSVLTLNVNAVLQASSSVASTSALSCYSIRYAFGAAQAASSSSISATSSVILMTSAIVSGESAFTSSITYITQPYVTYSCSSAIIALARKKWENEADIAESWASVADVSEIWTATVDTNETWTTVIDVSDTWTPVNDVSETWTRTTH